MSLKYEPASEPLHISQRLTPGMHPPVRKRCPEKVLPGVVVANKIDLEERSRVRPPREFIGNLLVRVHFIIVMIRWTGLAPWEFEFPSPGSPTHPYTTTSEHLCNQP